MLRKLDFLASTGAVPSLSKTAATAAEFMQEKSVAMRRLKVNFSLAAAREAVEASCCVVTLSVEQGHEGVLLWASWFVGGTPAEDEGKKKGPQVGRYPLDSELYSAVIEDAVLLRQKQKRKHVDVSYLDDGLSTRQLTLNLVEATKELLAGPMETLTAYLAQHSGVDSAVLILDRQLCTLPVEMCAPLTSMVAMARDLSLAMHLHRIAGKQPLDKGNARFIVDPRNEDIRGGYTGTVKRGEFTMTCEAFATDLQGVFSGGVAGNDHIPSNAELQKHISGVL